MREENAAIMKRKKTMITSFALAIILLALLVLSFIMYLNSTLGWFAHNNSVSSGTPSASVTEGEAVSISEYRVYKHDHASETVEEVSNNIYGDPLYLADFTMNEYDTILTEHNVDTHIVIRVVIDKVPDDKDGLKITLGNSTPIASGDEDEPLDSYVSSICAFYCAYGDPDDTPEEIYRAFEGSSAVKRVFTTVTRTGETYSNSKISSFDLTLSDYDSHVYTEGGVDKLCVYIEISYDDSLVSEYLLQNDYSSSSINDLLEMTVDFYNDLVPIVFVYTEAGA